MGTFDISRINFDPRKHYSSVRMQQGRVLTDDDYNEDNRIHEEAHRRTLVDVIGPAGSPDAGFKIENLVINAGRVNFDIHAGVFYLGGLRLELEETETYLLQKDWLQQPADLDKMQPLRGAERFDLVYVEAWQQAVSAVEDGSLFEVALGGPDTTTRLKTMRRVHLAGDVGDCDCSHAWQNLINKWKDTNPGTLNDQFELIRNVLLKVSFTGSGLPEDLCTPHAAGGYLGAENQAIRVQIVDQESFTWGFDNASPLYKVTVSREGTIVHMLTEPKDQYHWPLSNQVVEILAWSAVLPNGEKVATQKGHLSKVNASYNPDTGSFTLVTPLPPAFGMDWKNRAGRDELDNQTPSEYFYLRVWNRGDDLRSEPRIKFTSGTAVALGNTGMQVTITGKDIVAPDYWVIAARPETPNLVVPWELELKQGILPYGVRRFFAPLAVIRWTKTKEVPLGKVMHDCRKTFTPLTQQVGCCTYHVGDGIRSRGDFNSIQEAIDHLPGSGGKICVLPGEHIANVTILDRRQISISGCGDQTIIRPGPNAIAIPIFSIQSSQKIRIEQLTLVTFRGTAIEVRDEADAKTSSEEIIIRENKILAGIYAIKISTREDAVENNIDIIHNQIGMLDVPGCKTAIFSIADGVLIERNKIVVVAEFDPDDRNDPRKPGDTIDWDPFDLCFNPDVTFKKGPSFTYHVFLLLKYISLYQPYINYVRLYNATGGIQIGGTSERVWVKNNDIIGGSGNGISFGHLPEPQAVPVNKPSLGIKPTFIYSTSAYLVNTWPSIVAMNSVTASFNNRLYDISIEDNRISQMGTSGIGVIAFLSTKTIGLNIHVENLTVYRNTITNCCRQIPAEIPVNMQDEVGFGGISLSSCENGIFSANQIENNGINQINPICGIFILYAEKIDITNCRILNNGAQKLAEPARLNQGDRGGIVIKMSFPPANLFILSLINTSHHGVPALKVSGNIVSQPFGQALFVVAMGPVVVTGNQFTCHVLNIGTLSNNFNNAGCVFIFNLGVPADKIGFAAGILLNYLAHRNISDIEFAILHPGFGLKVLKLPSGKVMFAENQTTLDLRSSNSNSALSSQLIVSLDDIGFHNNQSECTASFLPGLGKNDVVAMNTYLLGITVRCNDNRFSDNIPKLFFSLHSIGFMSTVTGNQSSLCLIVDGSRKVVKNNMVLDDKFFCVGFNLKN